MRMYVDAMRDRERCIFAAPAARALCVQDVYRVALKKMRLVIDYFIRYNLDDFTCHFYIKVRFLLFIRKLQILMISSRYFIRFFIKKCGNSYAIHFVYSMKDSAHWNCI